MIKYLSKLFVPERIVHTVDKKQVLLVLPFLDPLLFEKRSCLQKCFKNYIPYCSLKVVSQSRSRISNLFNFKDVVNTKLSTHIVYKFMCSCCNTIYYGHAQRHFFVRASEYLGITPLTSKFVKTRKRICYFWSYVICYWKVIKLVLTIFRYFWKKAIDLNYSWRNLC